MSVERHGVAAPLTCFLVAVLLTGSSSGYAEIRLLAQDVAHFTVLSGAEVLVADMEGNFRLVEIERPLESTAWQPEWNPADQGWERAATLVWLSSSPDGEWVCFARFVAIPEHVLGPDEYPAWPLAVVVCRSDGTDARIVALSQEVGGGPGFDFTTDSRYLYGQPFLRCGVTLDDYLSWWRGLATGGSPGAYTRIDLETGERDGGNVDISDGYLSCPWSDLVAAGGYWDLWGIYDMSTCTPVYGGGDESVPFRVLGWVSEDALLVSDDGSRLYMRFGEDPGEPVVTRSLDRIDIYCRMPSGTYLFTTDGISVQYGNIDWRSGVSTELCRIPELDGTLTEWGKILAVPDGSGIVYDAPLHGGLCHTPAPED